MGETYLVTDGNKWGRKYWRTDDFSGDGGEWMAHPDNGSKFQERADAMRKADEVGGQVVTLAEVTAALSTAQLLTRPTATAEPKKVNEGGPAFPRPTSDQPGQIGISARDYFAAQALTGILAANAAKLLLPEPGKAAEYAYRYADAMIALKGKPLPDAQPPV